MLAANLGRVPENRIQHDLIQALTGVVRDAIRPERVDQFRPQRNTVAQKGVAKPIINPSSLVFPERRKNVFIGPVQPRHFRT